MLILWLGLAVLSLIALLFVAWPWLTLVPWRFSKKAVLIPYPTEVQADNKSLLLASRLTPAAQMIALTPEEMNISQSLSSTTVVAFLFWAVLMLGSAVLAYGYWGHYQALQRQKLLNSKAAQALLANPNVPAMVARLQAHLQKQPQSAEGWYLLAKLQMAKRDWQAAVMAFAKAQTLRPQHLATQLYYAEALFYREHEHLNNKARSLLAHVLQAAPTTSMALNLLAMDAYRDHKYAQAIIYWERMLDQFAPDSIDAETILQAIAKAQQQSRASKQ